VIIVKDMHIGNVVYWIEQIAIRCELIPENAIRPFVMGVIVIPVAYLFNQGTPMHDGCVVYHLESVTKYPFSGP
jgi:hypothetical protein